MEITKFCATDDPRAYLHKPMRHDGYLFATNGHIAVRIADDPAIEAGPMPQHLQKGILQEMAADTEERTWQPVPVIDKSNLRDCAYCNGTGRDVSQSFAISGAHIAARYLHLIATEIPGAEIGISKNPLGVQIIRAPGVVGCVMPMQP